MIRLSAQLAEPITNLPKRQEGGERNDKKSIEGDCLAGEEPIQRSRQWTTGSTSRRPTEGLAFSQQLEVWPYLVLSPVSP